MAKQRTNHDPGAAGIETEANWLSSWGGLTFGSRIKNLLPWIYVLQKHTPWLPGEFFKNAYWGFTLCDFKSLKFFDDALWPSIWSTLVKFYKHLQKTCIL